MTLPTVCANCGAARNPGRFCVACGEEFEGESTPTNPNLAIVGALAVYAVGQVLLIIESTHRLNLLDGAPAYASAVAWLELALVVFWIGGVIATGAGLLMSGWLRGRLILGAAVSVAVAQSCGVAAVIVEAVQVTKRVPSGPASTVVTSALAVAWLLVIAMSFYLLSFGVAAVAFLGRDWTACRPRRRRVLSIAFAIWAWAAAVALAAHLVLLVGAKVSGVDRTASIEELASDGCIVVAATLAAVAFGSAAAARVGPGRLDSLLAWSAGALVGVYVLTAVEYFTLGDHVPVDKVKTLYELHAWGSVVSAVAAVGLCGVLALRPRAASSA